MLKDSIHIVSTGVLRNTTPVFKEDGGVGNFYPVSVEDTLRVLSRIECGRWRQ